MASVRCNWGLKGELGPWVTGCCGFNWEVLGSHNWIRSVISCKIQFPDLWLYNPMNCPVCLKSAFARFSAFCCCCCCSYLDPLLFLFSSEPWVHRFHELSVTTLLDPKIAMYPTLLFPDQPKPQFLCPLLTDVLFSSLTVIWHLFPSSLTWVTLHDALPPDKATWKGPFNGNCV